MSRIKYLFVWVSRSHRLKCSCIFGLIIKDPTCWILAEGYEVAQGASWEEVQAADTASSFGHYVCPVFRGIFCLELEYLMAEIQTKDKFDILFLIHAGSAWASWKLWPQCDFFKLNTLSLSTSPKNLHSIYEDFMVTQMGNRLRSIDSGFE